MFLQYSLKTNRLKLMMTSTRKLAHHCLHQVKANLTFPSFQLQVTDWQARSSTVQCWRLTPLLRASLPQISPAGALLSSSPVRAHLCPLIPASNAFLRPSSCFQDTRQPRSTSVYAVSFRPFRSSLFKIISVFHLFHVFYP